MSTMFDHKSQHFLHDQVIANGIVLYLEWEELNLTFKHKMVHSVLVLTDLTLELRGGGTRPKSAKIQYFCYSVL